MAKKIALISILLVFFLTLCPLSPAKTQPSPSKDRAAARKALRNVRSLYQRGSAELAKDGSTTKLAKAESDIKKFIADFPQDKEVPEATRLLGAVYAQQGKHDQAITHFRQVMEKHPDHPASAYSRHALGESLFKQEKYDKAIEQFRAVIEAKTGRIKVKDKAKDKVKDETGKQTDDKNKDKMKKKISRFVALSEDSLRPVAQYKISQCYFKQGKTKESEKAIETLIATYPNSKMAKMIAEQLEYKRKQMKQLSSSSKEEKRGR